MQKVVTNNGMLQYSVDRQPENYLNAIGLLAESDDLSYFLASDSKHSFFHNHYFFVDSLILSFNFFSDL